jgi:transcriptional regulator with XRE-family HTH domain
MPGASPQNGVRRTALATSESQIPMDGKKTPGGSDLPAKIARLVEERGWNQEDFARISNLNRHTVREILKNSDSRRMRNATVKQCAKALGLEVNELRDLPLERLLPLMHNDRHVPDTEVLKLLQEKSTQPELVAWVAAQPERVAQLTYTEAAELIDIQGPNGPLARIGVEKYVELIERKRRLLDYVSDIAATEYLAFLEQFVHMLHDKIRPLPNR